MWEREVRIYGTLGVFNNFPFQKIVSYFPYLKQNFENTFGGCFQDIENVFNDIVVNKLKIVNPTYFV